jgi:hypothetical protein
MRSRRKRGSQVAPLEGGDAPKPRLRGIEVFEGEGFSVNMIAYLMSTGLAVELEDAHK